MISIGLDINLLKVIQKFHKFANMIWFGSVYGRGNDHVHLLGVHHGEKHYSHYLVDKLVIDRLLLVWPPMYMCQNRPTLQFGCNFWLLTLS